MKTICKESVGKEMIFDIATGIQETLEDIALSKMVDKSVPALDVQRARKAEEEKKRAEEEEAQKRRKIEEEEMEREKALQAEIEKELKRKREHEKEAHEKRRLSNIQTADVTAADTEDSILFDRAIKINALDGSGPRVFRKVCGMVKIAQGPIMGVYSVHPAFPKQEDRNLPLVLKQLEISDNFADSAEGKRQIQNLEQEVDSLRNLRHSNIIDLYESKVTRETGNGTTRKGSDGTSAGRWRISILTEFANRGSLRDLLETVETVNADTARIWAISLLEGLDYIHRSGAVHAGIHAGNVLLSRAQNESHPVPKLADVSYTPTLYKLIGKKRHSVPENWLPPELAHINPSAWVAHRKSDIWNFGVVFIQMIFGLRVVRDYDSPRKLMDSVHLSSSLYDFLESIFKSEPKERPTPFELLPSEFLRSDDPVIMDPSPRSRSPEVSRMSWSFPGNSHSRGRRTSVPNSGVPAVSRYATDFIELGTLGKGGYGRVVKARNKLDGQDYAIKIVRQKKASKMTNSLSEVMLLSRLTHSYLVRYFQAWVEDGVDSPMTTDDETTETDATETSATPTRSKQVTQSGYTDETESEESSDQEDTGFETHTGGLDLVSSASGYSAVEFGYDSDVFESESDDDDEEEDELDEEEESEDPSTEEPSPSPKKRIPKTKTLKHDKIVKRQEQENRKQTLYIQMSLAERQVSVPALLPIKH